MLLPHVEQKARLEKSDERHVAGIPADPVHVTASFGNSTQAAVRLPVCCWHIRHEQVCGFSGSPTASNLTEPHRHPPRYRFGFRDAFFINLKICCFYGKRRKNPCNIKACSR
jgi:hypothetical protein